MAGLPVRPAGAELSRSHQLRGRIARSPDRGRQRRPPMPHFAVREPQLCATGGAGEPHRQRAHARPRSPARASRTAARPQQPDDGCGLSRRHQGRRRCRRDHAAAARQGDRVPDHQGEDPAGAVRPPPGRGDGEGAAARRRTRARRVLGQRHARRARSADGQARLRAFHRLRHRQRRRLPHRLHLGHNRRAERHHALPSRHAGDLRQLRPPRAARAGHGPVHGLAAARFHLRARRPCAVPVACRRRHDPAGTRGAGRSARRRRAIRRHRLLHRADRLPRDAGKARRA